MDKEFEETDTAMENGAGTSNNSNDSVRAPQKCSKQCCAKFTRSNIFLILVFISILVGIGMGLGIHYNHPEVAEERRNLMYLNFPGKLLLRMLKMLIIPLVFTSLVTGMASLPTKSAGRMGGYAIAYFLITTFMAVLLGLLLVATIKPGRPGIGGVPWAFGYTVNPIDSLLDLIRNIFPDNIFAATMYQTRTEYKRGIIMVSETKTDASGYVWTEQVPEEQILSFSVTTVRGTNILGIILFSILLGLVIGRMGEKGEILYAVFDSCQTAIIKIINIFLWFTPIGIAFFLAWKLVRTGDIEAEFKSMAWYVLTVVVGLAIHGIIILPCIYVIFTRKNPFRLLLVMSKALLTALGTASSSATMPLTLNCLEEYAHVDKRVSRFMIPVGTTINMDGTALYQTVASIYLAQSLGYSLDAGNYVTVSLTATAASIGTLGLPQGGFFTMLIILTAIGLPVTGEALALIVGVDWLLDHCRTMINVWSDSIGAGVVEVMVKKELKVTNDFADTGHVNPGFSSAEKGIRQIDTSQL